MNRYDYRLIRQLLLFASVAEKGSFSQAAKSQSLSQTPLVTQINELEARLNIQFFNRTSQGVSLTPQGRAVLPIIQQLVDHVETVDYTLRKLNQTSEGILKVGSVLEGMFIDMPNLIERVRTELPNVAINTEEIDSSQAEYKLLTGEMDFVIGRFEGFSTPVLSLKLLRKVPLIIICSTYHPLAKLESVDLRDLQDEFWIVLGKSQCPSYVDRLERVRKEAGYLPKVRHVVDSILRQIAFVACQQGIALVPSTTMEYLPPAVKGVPLANSNPEIPINVGWNSSLKNPLRDRVLDEFLFTKGELFASGDRSDDQTGCDDIAQTGGD